MTTIRMGTLAGLAALILGSSAGAANITPIKTVTANGYTFLNFDGPTPNTGGTTIDGISNNGTVVGFTTAANGNLTNFTANPGTGTSATILNINNSTAAMANGINSTGTIVGFDGNNNGFSLVNGTASPLIGGGYTPAMAFGINDKGMIVGQYTTGASTPGFLLNGITTTTIDAPKGTTGDTVNAQGINNNGLIVGFYMGNDGQDHGFMASASSASSGHIIGTAVADPTIPNVPGEPGATFVFSQILGVNDSGIAVGYYGDSTTSQHGFLYNTITGKYTFLDDPYAGFHNGVEITQITGITNSGEITGFYNDANGVAHGFVAFAAVPEPGSMLLLGIGVILGVGYTRRRAGRTSAS